MKKVLVATALIFTTGITASYISGTHAAAFTASNRDKKDLGNGDFAKRDKKDLGNGDFAALRTKKDLGNGDFAKRDKKDLGNGDFQVA